MVLLLGCARPVFDKNKVVTSGPSPQEFTIKIKSWAHSDAELNQFFKSKKQHDQQLPNGNNGAGRRSFFTQKEASPITGRAEDIINPPVPNIDLSAIAFYQGGPHIQIVTKYWDSDLLTNYVGAFLKGTIKWLRKQSKTSKIKDDDTHRFCDVIPDQRYMRKLNGRLVDEMMTLIFRIRHFVPIRFESGSKY
ncbi:unnamed protein product [Rhizophagus irregularis]|nr:unnamed protein product [Rhizophagus irregularis]